MVTMTSRDAQLTTFVGVGELTCEELSAAIFRFLENGASRFSLWDLSKASLDGVDPESIRILASRVAHAGRGRRLAGKSAVVCGLPVDLRRVQMLAVYLSIEGYPVEVVPFSGLEPATMWLARYFPT